MKNTPNLETARKNLEAAREALAKAEADYVQALVGNVQTATVVA